MPEDTYPPDEQRMLDLIRHLAVEIGPRPAGSAAERAAHEYLAGLLRGWGYQVEFRPAPFAPLPAFLPSYSLGAAAFLGAAAVLPVFPWLALTLPLVPAVLPALTHVLTRRLPRTGTSQNLFAAPAGCAWKDLDLVIAAHVDTAHANPVQNDFLRGMQDSIYPSMQRIAWILAFIGLAAAACQVGLTGIPFPPVLHYAALLGAGLLALALVSFDLAEQRLHRAIYAPGAYDNASGVAVLMAAAAEHAAGAEKHAAAAEPLPSGEEQLATGEENTAFAMQPIAAGEVQTAPETEPPSRLRVGFLLTGAEETGLHGAEAAAAFFRAVQAAPPVLVIDQVGAGSRLHWVRKLGRLRPRHTHPGLNELLRRANPALEPLDHPARSSDYEPFLRAGIPAAGLESSGSKAAAWAYHTVHDTPTVIEMHALAECLETVYRLIWILDKESRVESRE